MAQLKTKLSEFARVALPVAIGGLLWSYLAAAILVGAVMA